MHSGHNPNENTNINCHRKKYNEMKNQSTAVLVIKYSKDAQKNTSDTFHIHKTTDVY